MTIFRQASSEKHRQILAAVTAAARRGARTRPRKPRISKRAAAGAKDSGATGVDPRGVDLSTFLRGYYANVSAEDLYRRDAGELAVLALSQLRWAERRRGRALVRVFNPTLRDDGYTSAHTVIEMVNDDMPFLVDSIGLALTQRSLTLHFLAHPIFAVTRDAGGTLTSLSARGRSIVGGKQRLESYQHIEVDRIVDPGALRALHAQIEGAMRDVRAACADWVEMQSAARRAADELNSLGTRFDARDVSEAQALLAWMQHRHFTFLGYREYVLRGTAGHE